MEKIEEAIEALPRWSFENKEAPKLNLVRKGRIFRFEDDVMGGSLPETPDVR